MYNDLVNIVIVFIVSWVQSYDIILKVVSVVYGKYANKLRMESVANQRIMKSYALHPMEFSNPTAENKGERSPERAMRAQAVGEIPKGWNPCKWCNVYISAEGPTDCSVNPSHPFFVKNIPGLQQKRTAQGIVYLVRKRG